MKATNGNLKFIYKHHRSAATYLFIFVIVFYRYAQYSHFKIHSEADYYKLEIDGYEGNAGDSLNDPWYGSNNSPFSTYNKDNDRSSLNCASMLKVIMECI